MLRDLVDAARFAERVSLSRKASDQRLVEEAEENLDNLLRRMVLLDETAAKNAASEIRKLGG